jgi:FkbM family methyltransferase
MNRLLKRISRDLVKFVATFNMELPQILEQDMAHIQGKGFGVESISHEVRLAQDFLNCRTAAINEKSIVFDVGANIGNWTREYLKHNQNCAIFAFEPSLTSCQKLIQNIKKTNVNIENFGFSNNVGDMILYSDKPGSSISSLTKRNLEHFQIEFKYEEIVKIDTLNNYCKANSIIPDLLKIDVEGYEMDVLLGSLEVIDKISIIQFEFGGCNIDTRTFFQDFWYFFKKHDFTLYRIANNGPVLVNRYREADEYFSTTNYLATNNRMFA